MKGKTRVVALLAVLVSRPLMAVDVEEEGLHYWPQWRGPTWNGVASQADPPATWGETENLRWKTAIEGLGHGTPVIWDDRIFIQTAIPLDRKLPALVASPGDTPNLDPSPEESVTSWKAQRFAVLCIERKSGKRLWRRTVLEVTPHQGHHRKGGFASQSAVTDGERVYAYFGSFGLYCFDFDGNLVWKQDPRPLMMEAGLGEGSSPALHGDTLVIVADQERGSHVVALDKRTGREIWKQDRDEVSNWSTPRIFTHAGRRQVVLNGATVRSYDLATGEPLWGCGGQSLSAVPMPAVGHGLVFATSGWRRDTLHAIKLGQRGDLTGSKHVVWSLKRGTPYVPSPMLWGEEIYLLEDRRFFSCLRAVDGEPHYLKHRLPGSLAFSASPVGAADRIYLVSEEGKTIVLQRGGEINVLAINELDETFLASPAIVGNAIYLRGDRHLYCFARPVQ